MNSVIELCEASQESDVSENDTINKTNHLLSETNDVLDGSDHENQDENEDRDDNSSTQDHNRSWCNICKKDGDLLCCDRCPRAYHLSCLKMSEEDLPEGEWYCEYCL